MAQSVTVQPPEIEELTLSLVERNKATYVAYAGFDFQAVWTRLQQAGAESINMWAPSRSSPLSPPYFFLFAY